MPATDGFFRSLSKTHNVFAFSSLLLLAATLWMLYDDHNDEWRVWQQKFDRIEEARLSGIGLDQQDQLTSKTEELKTQIAERKTHLATIAGQLETHRTELAVKQAAAAAELRVTKPLRTFRDVARANYDLAVRDNDPSMKAKLADFHAKQKTVDDAERKLRAALDDTKGVQQDVAQLTGEETDAEKTLAALEAALELTDSSRNVVAPDSTIQAIKRWLMEQPVIDGFNSHHRVQQDWLPDQRITLGMTATARFDRCRTCHLSIDRVLTGNVPEFPFAADAKADAEPASWVAAGGYPHPFATHPRPDLYLTAASPHPLTEFGCTVCHDGQGSATSFHNAQHGPNHPADYKKWNAQYGFFPNHHWEFPMQPRRLRESTCLKCHHQVVDLGINPDHGPTAPKLYKGWQLVRTFGCFGCHEISGFDGINPIGPDLRLEPATAELKAALEADPNQFPGKMRKVGPSLAHVALKTNSDWLARWIRKPSDFRPTTRMPQFFDLSNQDDLHGKQFGPAEIAAVTHFLLETSRKASADFKLDTIPEGITADAGRGEITFRERGCLACHSHKAIPDPGKQLSATFGPDLSRIQDKITHDTKNPIGASDSGFRWLYTWLRDPRKHFSRTRMPDLFLDPEGKGDKRVDPAADIAAFLLSQPTTKLTGDPVPDADDSALDQLVKLYAGKVIGAAAAESMVDDGGRYPESDKSKIKGDEVELHGDSVTREMKLTYVGRRTVSRYGCYGCHDIPGFETARPIGTKLEDWGRKDRTKLASEHIEEFLLHHGEADNSSTRKRVDKEMARARAHSLGTQKFENRDIEEDETRAAFFYSSLLHHGREGFLWQKLRDPRSYDYKKTETKGYDERLRMPKFTFAQDPMENEKAIEAIATFILGLVAEPPPVKYVYQPDTWVADRIEGERLLQKFNCVGCHMVELPEIAFRTKPSALPGLRGSNAKNQTKPFSELLGAKTYPGGLQALGDGKPTRVLEFRSTSPNPEEQDIHIRFRGQLTSAPDPEDEESTEYSYTLWETLHIQLRDPRLHDNNNPDADVVWEDMLLPSSVINVDQLDRDVANSTAGRGGRFTEWLVKYLVAKPNHKGSGSPDNSRQMSPPPLFQEGLKVQTPWLYRFLKDPSPIRRTTVLRMPRFNLNDDEAQALANYFAAVDRAEYPYQSIPQRQDAWLAKKKGQDARLAKTKVTDTAKTAADTKKAAEMAAKNLTDAQAAAMKADDEAAKQKAAEVVKAATDAKAKADQAAADAAKAATYAKAAAATAARTAADINQYLDSSWQILTDQNAKTAVCTKCHQVAGIPVLGKPGEDIFGPNLDFTANRLKPKWLLMWLHNPKWATPYTSMPQVFVKGQVVLPERLGGDGEQQIEGVRDALINYHRLVESRLRSSQPPKPQGNPADAGPSAAGAEGTK